MGASSAVAVKPAPEVDAPAPRELDPDEQKILQHLYASLNLVEAAVRQYNDCAAECGQISAPRMECFDFVRARRAIHDRWNSHAQAVSDREARERSSGAS